MFKNKQEEREWTKYKIAQIKKDPSQRKPTTKREVEDWRNAKRGR